jgi:predicted methyltransferase MtxX (methanogen marker protein 4)
MSTESKQLSSRGELLALLKKKFPGDDRERTYLQLLIEGQAKAAIKGNVEAAKLLLRYAHLADNKARVAAKKRPRLKNL